MTHPPPATPEGDPRHPRAPTASSPRAPHRTSTPLSQRPRRRLREWTRRRTWVDLWITSVITLVAAAVSMVLEDVLPWPEQVGVVTWWRIGLLAVSLLLLFWGLAVRRRMNDSQGTWYYVRFLLPWMYDWVLPHQRQHARGYLDRRVIAAHVTSAPSGGVIDCTDEIATLAEAITASMNSDDSDTGYTVAPNMLYPAALALGYRMYGWESLRMYESFGASSIDWGLPTPTLPGRTDSAPRMPPEWSAVPVVREHVSTDLPPEQVTCVLVTADLTASAPGRDNRSTPPIGFTPQVTRRLAVFEDDAGADGPIEAAARSVKIVRTLRRGEHRSADMHPLVAVHGIRHLLDSALHDYPRAVVYVVLRAPKTVALVSGFALSGPGRQLLTPGISGTWAYPRCDMTDCGHPWRRLAPLLLDQERRDAAAQGHYVLMRVHPEQPAAAELARTAARDGLRLSRATDSAARPADASRTDGATAV